MTGGPLQDMANVGGLTAYCIMCGEMGPSALTKQEGTLTVEDQHHAVLQLGGQVEGEARPRKAWLWRKNSAQHIVHDVVTVRGVRGKLRSFIYVAVGGFVAVKEKISSQRRQMGGGEGSPGGLHSNSQDLPASDLLPFGGDKPEAGNTEQRSEITCVMGRRKQFIEVVKKNSCLPEQMPPVPVLPLPKLYKNTVEILLHILLLLLFF